MALDNSNLQHSIRRYVIEQNTACMRNKSPHGVDFVHLREGVGPLLQEVLHVAGLEAAGGVSQYGLLQPELHGGAVEHLRFEAVLSSSVRPFVRLVDWSFA